MLDEAEIAVEMETAERKLRCQYRDLRELDGMSVEEK